MVLILALRDDSVMAVCASTGHNLGMVKGSRQPCIGGVTVITFRRCGQVIGRQTVRNHPVMTAGTATEYLEVIHLCDRFPHAGGVAVFAHLGSIDVVWSFIGRDDTIVTTATAFGNTLVIKSGW